MLGCTLTDLYQAANFRPGGVSLILIAQKMLPQSAEWAKAIRATVAVPKPDWDEAFRVDEAAHCGHQVDEASLHTRQTRHT